MVTNGSNEMNFNRQPISGAFHNRTQIHDPDWIVQGSTTHPKFREYRQSNRCHHRRRRQVDPSRDRNILSR